MRGDEVGEAVPEEEVAAHIGRATPLVSDVDRGIRGGERTVPHDVGDDPGVLDLVGRHHAAGLDAADGVAHDLHVVRDAVGPATDGHVDALLGGVVEHRTDHVVGDPVVIADVGLVCLAVVDGDPVVRVDVRDARPHDGGALRPGADHDAVREAVVDIEILDHHIARRVHGEAGVTVDTRCAAARVRAELHVAQGHERGSPVDPGDRDDRPPILREAIRTHGDGLRIGAADGSDDERLVTEVTASPQQHERPGWRGLERE
ncbi:MAG: hypothetical protein U0353_18560 [Sandaracinus sp.]